MSTKKPVIKQVSLLIIAAIFITFLTGLRRTSWIYPYPCVMPNCVFGYAIGFPFSWWSIANDGQMYVRTIGAVTFGLFGDVLFWFSILLIGKLIFNKINH